jgi:fructosamine-3-kinase
MNVLPFEIKQDLHHFLSLKFGSDFLLRNFTPFAGGCINNGGKILTNRGAFFLKWNSAMKFPGMFAAEGKGLRLLASKNAIRIPQVINSFEQGDYQYIMLEFIESRQRSPHYWHLLGQKLALLHKNTHEYFGLDHDNYIGSLHQQNQRSGSWIDFFITHRLNVQLAIAVDQGSTEKSLVKKFETLYKKLPSILTNERPALVHGDLWSGNLITDDQGQPCLIDPAVYYGHREVDLAMTQLFGGFSSEFYDSYREVFPLAPGSRQRFDLYNLYPLLVHVNLFGKAYLRQVLDIIDSFV